MPKDRSLLGKTTETPEINDRLFRLDVLFFVLDIKPIQCFFQFFTVRAILHRVDYYRAHFFSVNLSELAGIGIRNNKPITFSE